MDKEEKNRQETEVSELELLLAIISVIIRQNFF
jgi:hypothetical protein